MGNPISLIDPDGKEPNRAQSTSVAYFLEYLRQHRLTTIQDIYNHLKENSSTALRYIYTHDEGWIDMNHVFSVFVNGKAATDMLEPLSGNAIARKILFNGDGATSYFSYEDLPSNRVGLEMLRRLRVDQLEGADLYMFLQDELWNRGATYPENAPNYGRIPEDKDRDVLFDSKGNVKMLTKKELSTGYYVPQNFTDKPYNLSDFAPAPYSIIGRWLEWRYQQDNSNETQENN
jgi:hypothetical protein